MLLCVCVVLLLLLFSRLRWIHTLSIIHYSVNIEKSLPLTVFDLVVFTPDWQFCVQQCIPVFHAWFGGLNCVEGIWMSDSSWARGRARTHTHTHTHTHSHTSPCTVSWPFANTSPVWQQRESCWGQKGRDRSDAKSPCHAGSLPWKTKLQTSPAYPDLYWSGPNLIKMV